MARFPLNSLRGERRISERAIQKIDRRTRASWNWPEIPFHQEDFLAGEVTPVFFASALTNFGLSPFSMPLSILAPCPHARLANQLDGREIEDRSCETPFSGYVFKLQANMDRRHRDSMAFLRICSGRFERDLVVKHHRLGREMRLSRPHGMVAGERTTLDLAYRRRYHRRDQPRPLCHRRYHLSLTGDLTSNLCRNFNLKFLPDSILKMWASEKPLIKAFSSSPMKGPFSCFGPMN